MTTLYPGLRELSERYPSLAARPLDSGYSRCVLYARTVARVRGLGTFGLTGRNGGARREFCDVVLGAPANQAHHVQVLHWPIYLGLCPAPEGYLVGHNGVR